MAFSRLGARATLGSDAIRHDLVVGDLGDGTLTIQDGGDAFGRIVTLGNFLGADGVLTVTGQGSTLATNSTFSIGALGEGLMTISSGGKVDSTFTAFIGNNGTGEGFVNVLGAGSQWTTPALEVGNAGRGTMTVSNAGRVTSTSGALGDGTGAVGFVTVAGAGSAWEVGSQFDVGDFGSGTLTVSTGGRVEGSSSMVIADEDQSSGQVTITGAGSEVAINSSLTLGDAGAGRLDITDGGAFSSGLAATLGIQPTGSGVMSVSGAGSRFSASSLIVASQGGASVTVSDGAEVDLPLVLDINDPAGSSVGEFTLDGGSVFVGSTFTNDGVFNFHDGLLQVEGPFRPQSVASGYVIDGQDVDDLPTLDLVSQGTPTTNITTLTVGDQRRGELRVRQARSVTVDAVQIGADAGSEGTVVLDASSTLTATTTVSVGGTIGALGGAGLLEVKASSRVIAETLRVFSDGVVRLDGGDLQFDTLSLSSGAEFDWVSGDIILTDNFFLSPSNLPILLGPNGALTPGRQLAAGGGSTLTVATPVTVDGGELIGGITNDSAITVDSGLVAGSVTNNGLIFLGGLSTARMQTSVVNNGTISGAGRIENAVQNNTDGQISVTVGEKLVLLSTLDNSGHVSVIGGELQADGAVTNAATTGLISARDAILRFNGGVTNDGGVAFSNGTVDVYGDITQNVGGRITVSNGGIANFYDDVTIDAGAADVQATAIGATVSRVVFFGDYNGGVTGGGQAFIEGDHRPGDSPGVVQFGGDVAYGFFSTLEIEIGGTTPGTEYDRVEVDGVAQIDGKLRVELIDLGGGVYEPKLGDSFGFLASNGGAGGIWHTLDLPELAPGLEWMLNPGGVTISLNVVAALEGDYNFDGVVDALDYAVWREALGQVGVGLAADGDLSGVVDAGDLQVWRDNYGAALPAAVASTPEPAACGLLTLALLAAACPRRQR